MKTTTFRQRGIATILILLLTGFTLLVVVLGTMYYLNGAQEQGITVHGETQAQLNAWTGVGIVQQYLQQTADNDVTNSTSNLKTLAQAVANSDGAGVTLAISGIDGITARVVAVDSSSSPTQFTVDITGVTANDTRAQSSATIETVFSTESTSSSSATSCSPTTKASAVFKGDLSITGGSTSFTNGSNYESIAVEGNLTLGSAATAKISGCATGNITLSGGGIYANAMLTSQNGSITINSMSTPSNVSLWAKTISIGNTGSGSYAAIKAGAYTASVIADGKTVGTANVGGKILDSSDSIPWVTGTLVPWSTGTMLVTLTDGTEYLVDMTAVSINASTGEVTGATAASTLLSGSTAMPDDITLSSESLFGGDISLYTLSVAQLWGYDVTVSGWSGTYTDVEVAGNLDIVTGTISKMTGGGYVWATSGGCSGSSCWSIPTFSNSSNIAGKFYYGSSKTVASSPPSHLNVSQSGTTPGLPGQPYCDTSTPTIDVSSYASQANYIFSFKNSVPTLTIQNVKTSSGTSLDGTYNLQTDDTRKLGGSAFLTCNWQTDATNSSAYCGRSATSSTGWNLAGITHFPPGVALFYGNLTIDGVNSSTQAKLVNTLLSTGSVTLTSSGHVPLYAPNQAGATATCGGNTYPTNLCASNSPAALATWTDGDGETHTGLPIANLALGADYNLVSSGWTIYGNVIVGKAASSSGATSTVYGRLTVGANRTDSSDTSTSTSITAGGFVVDTSSLTDDQSYDPNECSSTPATSSTINVLWTRYL